MPRLSRAALVLAALALPLAAAQNAPEAPIGAPIVPTSPAAPPNFASAAYRLLPARFEGNLNVVTPEQRAAVEQAVAAELPAALTRRYPGARLMTEAGEVASEVGTTEETIEDAAPAESAGAVENAVAVVPVVVLPPALTPFSAVELRLELLVPGETAPRVFRARLNVLNLWLSGQNAARQALDAVFASLP